MEVNQLYEAFFDFKDSQLPYLDDVQVWQDQFAFLDLCFTLIAGAKGFDADAFPAPQETGNIMDISVASSDLEALLVSDRRTNRRRGLSDAAGEQVVSARYHIESRRRRGLKQGFMSRLDMVTVKFGLHDLERFSLLLALAAEYDRKYEAVYTYLHNNASDYCPTRWLAVKLYRYLFGQNAGEAALLSGISPLCRFLCESGMGRPDRAGSAQRLLLSPRVTAYLLGRNETADTLREFCRIYPAFDMQAFVPVREEDYRFISSLFREKLADTSAHFACNLYGPSGIGRTYAAGRAASEQGLRLLRVDLCKLIHFGGDDIRRQLDGIYTEAQLTDAVPCFHVDEAMTEQDGEGGIQRSPLADKIRRTAEYIAALFRIFFWVTPEKDDAFAGTQVMCISRELPMLTANERRSFWDAYLPEAEDTVRLANQYILTPDAIRKAAQTAADLAAIEKSGLTQELLARCVRQQSVNQLGAYATRINAVFTWDDLVVSDDQKRRMKMICDQVRYRSVVNEDWGFRKKSPYGRGLCALFYGSPGTGKTMAVQVMANELGLDLYRIDLSQLSSKYIGETQKNISTLFNKAKNINAMLFFDEADSMFAKRSEVKDANDRYANADTAFLLQKLEDYEGITILATNYVNNIDDAFKRRIKFMINFAFPMPDVRLMLWKRILPPSAVTDEPIDFEFFAEHFELSGSNIKEILTNAAYLAAAEGTGLRNSHIVEAVKLNFSKYGKILDDSQFGYLAV